VIEDARNHKALLIVHPCTVFMSAQYIQDDTNWRLTSPYCNSLSPMN